MAALQDWIAEAQAAGVIGFDTETDSLDALRANLVGLSIATAPGRACYVPLRHVAPGAAGQSDMLAAPAEAPPPETGTGRELFAFMRHGSDGAEQGASAMLAAAGL